MDLVSVLISTYNSEKWIISCVNSILNQTYKNLQIVIVDDGSSDKTIEKLSIIKDPRIEVYKKKHTGISDSLNYGLTKTRSYLIVKVDSDDYSSPNRIEEQYNFVKRNNEYGLVGSNFISVDKNGKILQKVNYPEKHKQIIEQMPRKCCVFHGSIIINKALIEDVGGYNNDLKVAEDWDLFLKLIDKTKFYNIQKYLVNKVFHKNAVSLSSYANIEAEKVLLGFNKKQIEKTNYSKIKAKAHFNIGYHYYYESNFKKSSYYFKKSTNHYLFNLQNIRYYISSKFLSCIILFFRKHQLYKVFNPIRRLDKGNKYFRNKF